MLVRLLFKTFDLLQLPWAFRLIWPLLTRNSRLTAEELEAAGLVLGLDAVRYSSVRVAEGRLLRLIFKLNKNRALTIFRTINLPATGHHSRGNLDLIVHEMVHVYQFEGIGSIYIWQALAAQRSKEGYRYGGWEKLAEDRQNGWRFSNYNREQQGQIAQDYYDDVLTPNLPPDSPTRLAFQPFIDDLQAGKL
jgi:hypothetical protein